MYKEIQIAVLHLIIGVVQIIMIPSLHGTGMIFIGSIGILVCGFNAGFAVKSFLEDYKKDADEDN